MAGAAQAHEVARVESWTVRQRDDVIYDLHADSFTVPQVQRTVGMRCCVGSTHLLPGVIVAACAGVGARVVSSVMDAIASMDPLGAAGLRADS
ncbi:MAG TPA: hypothetical protein VNL98_04855 [Gemmatimonadales bacterium]|nr:hypothetical protein [Gemmatimonadales bacterium]